MFLGHGFNSKRKKWYPGREHVVQLFKFWWISLTAGADLIIIKHEMIRRK